MTIGRNNGRTVRFEEQTCRLCAAFGLARPNLYTACSYDAPGVPRSRSCDHYNLYLKDEASVGTLDMLDVGTVP